MRDYLYRIDSARTVNTSTVDRDDKESGRFVDARLLEELIAQWRKSAQNVSIWNAETYADGIEACADELAALVLGDG